MQVVNVVTSTLQVKEVLFMDLWSPNLTRTFIYSHPSLHLFTHEIRLALSPALHGLQFAKGGTFVVCLEVVHFHTMADSSLTYFTCTLGQAAATKNVASSNAKTINDFLESQAQLYPRLPAVGFPVPVPNKGEWSSEVFCRFPFPILGLNLNIDAS